MKIVKKNVLILIVGIALSAAILFPGCRIIDATDPEAMGVKSVNFVLDNSDSLVGKRVMVEGYVAYVNASGATFTGQKITDISLVDSPADIKTESTRPDYGECIELLIFSDETPNLKVGDKIVVLCSVHQDGDIGVYYDFIQFVEHE